MSIRISNTAHNVVPLAGASMQELAVTASAVSASPFPAGTDVVLVSVQLASVRVRYDEADPDTDTGFILNPNHVDYWSLERAQAARFVRDGDINGEVVMTPMAYAPHNARRNVFPCVSFDEVWDDVLRMMEYNPENVNLSTSDQLHIVRRIENALRIAWEWDFWPPCEVTECREVVTLSTGSYIPHIHSVDLPIGTVQGVFSQDPRVCEGQLQVPFTLSHRGIEIPERIAAKSTDGLWVEYRLRVPRFTRTEWDVVAPYNPGDLVYWPDTGECYECRYANTGKTPDSMTYWEKQCIPHYFREYLMLDAAGQYFRADGQYARGAELRNDARAELIRTRDVHFPQQQQRTFATVRIS